MRLVFAGDLRVIFAARARMPRVMVVVCANHLRKRVRAKFAQSLPKFGQTGLWVHGGYLLALRWPCVGHVLAMCWPCVGLALVLRWPCAGLVLALRLTSL